MIFMTLYRICLTGLRAHSYIPFGVPCGRPLPLPLGEVAERSECPKGRSTRENILPLPLGEVAECSECPKGKSTRENILPLLLGEVAERSEDGEGNQ